MELIKNTLIATFMIIMTSLSMQHKHFMMSLMCIEAMMLLLFMMLTLSTSTTTTLSHTPLPMMLLTVSISGAAVGLSLVVAITRTHGSDFLNNLNLL